MKTPFRSRPNIELILGWRAGCSCIKLSPFFIWRIFSLLLDLWKVWWFPSRPICLAPESRIPWNPLVKAYSKFDLSTWRHGRSKQILSNQGQASKGWRRLVFYLLCQWHIVLAAKQVIWILRSRLARIQSCLDSVKSDNFLVDDPKYYMSSQIKLEYSPILHFVKSTH